MKRSSSSSSSAPPSSSKTVPSKASYPFIVSGSTARIIHTLLPLTIVVIGILACPEGPEAYIRAFLTLFLAIAGTILSSAWIAEFAYEYIFCCRRLQADKTESSKMRYQEGWETTRASWMFASLAAFVRTRYLAGKPTAIVFTLAEAQPEAPDALWLYIVKLILVTLLVDFYMYFKHRLLHWRPLFAFHRDHHTFHNPSPFASFAVAPVEAFLTFSPVLLLCFPQLPILAQAYGLWVTGFVWLNLYLHAGFVGKFSETVLRSIGLNSSSFHNIHHEKTIQNFGELMYIWDTILATGAHPMLRLTTLATIASIVMAHSLREGPHYCSELTPEGTVRPECADPAWVTKYSQPLNGAGPEQIWINYGYTPDAMVAGWLTSDMTAGTTVQWGTTSGNYPNQANGNSTYYVYSSKYTSGLIHHATMTNLSPATTYYYRVGDASGWSSEYSFKSSPGVGPIYPFTFGFVADVGEGTNPQNTIDHLVSRLPNIDAMSINGDISYASGCESNGCSNWDAFQRMVQPVSAVRPWSVNIGNHETYDTANGIVAISTRYRFSGMPYPKGSKDDIWYFSYEVGPAHVISMSSFYTGGFGPSSPLTTWLNSDLASINRAKTPWVLVVIHAPWYNSNSAHQGDGEAMRQAYEQTLINARVNCVFSGHVHAYERSTNVNNNKVVPNGQGMVHFNIGDGGADLYTTWLTQPAWSAFRQATWGHGEFQIMNSTAAVWTWNRNEDNANKVTDSFTVYNTVTM